MMEHDSDYSEFVKKLIDAVRERHCIYDKKHTAYFNKIERERAWCEIADVLGQSVDDCQKRWKLLREKLAKELKKRDRALACGERFHSDWICFEKIVFIEEHIAPRKKLEKYPFFLAPVDFQDKFMHGTCDASDHSTASQKHTNENHEQQQQQHEQDYNNLSSSYHHNAKRHCQLNSSHSPVSEMDLSNKNHKETSPLDENKIKTEPNEMVEIDDISTEPDMYEMEMMEEKNRPRRNSYAINVPNGNEFSNEPHKKKPLQLKRFDVELATGLQRTTYQHSMEPNNNAQINTKPLTSKKSAGDNEDCDKLFGKMVTAMLKDIPVEEHKDDVKLHIMQMLIRAKRGHLGSYN